MTIPVTCNCGKKLRAKPEMAGRRVKCPACGEVRVVPDPASGVDSDAGGPLDLTSLAAAETAQRPLPRTPLQPTARKADGTKVRLIIALSAGVGGAVLLLLATVILWPFGSPEEETRKQPGAVTDGSSSVVNASRESSNAGNGASASTWPAATGAARTYPSIPGAVTEPPPWIGREAPFDVAKFFEAPPVDENAAPLYLDALFEFSSELSICYAPVGQPPQGETLRRAEAAQERYTEFKRFDPAWEKDPKALNEAAVDAWLAQYRTGFQKLAEAQKRPQCVFEAGVGVAALTPHIQARQVVRIVKWRAWRDLANGNIDRPIQDVELVLRLSRDLQPRGGAICQVVSLATDDLCCEEVIPQILNADGIKQEHCDHLIGELARHEAVSKRRFTEALRMEYLIARKALHDFQHHTGDFSPQAMKDMGLRGPADTPLSCLQLLISLGAGGDGRLAKEKYGKGANAARLSPDHPLVAGWTHDGKLLSDSDYAKEVAALNTVYASILSYADRTPFERVRACHDPNIVKPLRDTNLALLFEPSRWWEQALIRGEATLNGTKCLVALRRWQLEQDGPPPDLETILQAAGMPEVPADPFNGRPLQMTTVDGEPVIYSVAMDGKDDRGRVDIWNSSQPGKQGDLLFRLIH